MLGLWSLQCLGSWQRSAKQDSLDENLDEDDSSDDVFREVFFWDMSKYFKSTLRKSWDLKTNGLEIPEKNPPKKRVIHPNPDLFVPVQSLADSDSILRWWTCTS